MTLEVLAKEKGKVKKTANQNCWGQDIFAIGF